MRPAISSPTAPHAAGLLVHEASAKLARAAWLLDTTGVLVHPSALSAALLALVLRTSALAGELHAASSTSPARAHMRTDDAELPPARTGRAR